MRLIGVVFVFLSLTTAPLFAEDTRQEPFGEWLLEFQDRALAVGIDPDVVENALGSVSYQEDSIRRDRRQSEFTKTIWEYLDTAVSDLRVSNGRAALDRYDESLIAIEQAFGVEKEVVVAIWGLESSFGAFRGNVDTISALATLSYDARRSAFFEAQLIAALRIIEAGDVSLSDMTGSWAGAMGHTQFMPTSFLEHAQDFTDDGRRDIWSDDPRDALASAAAYLAAFGWETGVPWGVEVRVPDGFDYLLTGERMEKSASDWEALGIRTVTGASLPPSDKISIRLLAGHRGAAFATYPNFQVLERYNTADAYVVGVGHLSDRLRGGDTIAGGWPREDRALTYDERVEMQELLRAVGFDPQKIDGRVGPLTLDAIQRWQRSKDIPADGYINSTLLADLRRDAGR